MSGSEEKARAHALAKLEPFVGEWTARASIQGAPAGLVTFEWALGGQFLVQRSEVPHPDAPDGLELIAPNRGGDGYTKHYFDSRGVVRIYQMTLEGPTWTVRRERPDFTPLDFHQRYIGTFSDDGATISGAWESSSDGRRWRRDFELSYERAG